MPARPRRTAHERQQRDLRILASMRSGFSYAEIARTESLSHERVRQIVGHSLEQEKRGTRVDTTMLQIARLEPALRLAARGVEEGELKAIGPLLKVLVQLDKYMIVANARHVEGESVRQKLLDRLNRMSARMLAEREAEPPEAPAAEGEDENLDDAEVGGDMPATH